MSILTIWDGGRTTLNTNTYSLVQNTKVQNTTWLEGKYGTRLSRGTDNESIIVSDDSLVISIEGK